MRAVEKAHAQAREALERQRDCLDHLLAQGHTIVTAQTKGPEVEIRIIPNPANPIPAADQAQDQAGRTFLVARVRDCRVYWLDIEPLQAALTDLCRGAS